MNKKDQYQRRAEKNGAVVEDLCVILMDLFLAESRLLNMAATPILEVDACKRWVWDAALASVHHFLSDLPPHYVLRAESTSKVLMHTRLMEAALQADGGARRAAVNITNPAKRKAQGRGGPVAAASGTDEGIPSTFASPVLQMVTNSSADCADPPHGSYRRRVPATYLRVIRQT